MGRRITGAEDRVAVIAQAQLGLFTRRQALDVGCGSRHIERRLASGVWVVRFRGVYTWSHVEPTAAGDALAAVLAVGAPAAACLRTAASLWGLDGMRPPREPEVVTSAPRHLCPDGVAVRRSRTLGADDITTRWCVPVTTAARTLLDLAGRLDPDALEDALDDAIRRNLVTARAVLTRIDATQRRGVPGAGVLRAIVVPRLGRRVSGSKQENRLRRLLARAGLPQPVSQYVVRDPEGRFAGRVDLAYPDRRIAIEYDSYEFHTGRRRFASDVRRARRIEDAGWVRVPAMSEDIDEGGADLVAHIVRLYEERAP